jgi:hypothetical protein
MRVQARPSTVRRDGYRAMGVSVQQRPEPAARIAAATLPAFTSPMV